jgi:hypothetical protein
MIVYHGTDGENARRYACEGIDAHLLHTRATHGLQDNEPGLFVTPRFDVARRFGLYVIQIEVEFSELNVPPELRQAGASLEQALAASFEPQAFIASRIEPSRVSIVESHPNGYPFNPFDDSVPLQGIGNDNSGK